MTPQDDERYAQVLAELAERDTARLIAKERHAMDGSTATWFAEELRRQAETLRLSPGTAARLRACVERLRETASQTRRQENGHVGNGADHAANGVNSRRHAN